ncbi:hypothetical protein ABK040_009225 [Willaertia magna]
MEMGQHTTTKEHFFATTPQQKNTLHLELIEEEKSQLKEIVEGSYPTIPYINCAGYKEIINNFLKHKNSYFQQILCRTERTAFLTDSNELHYFINRRHYVLQKPKNLNIYYMSGSYDHLMLLVDRITILNEMEETKTFKIETNNNLYDHQLPNGEIIKVPRLFSVIAFDEKTATCLGENKINLIPIISNLDIKSIYLLKDVEDVVNNNEFITYMACAARTSVFVTNFGRLYVCGGNQFGDTGMGGVSDVPKVTLHKIFKQRTDIYFVKVTAGDHNMIALTNDGRVFVCGYNAGNQLGVINNAQHQQELIESPQFCDHSEYVIDIASQYYSTIYLTKSGKLFVTNSGAKQLISVNIPNGCSLDNFMILNENNELYVDSSISEKKLKRIYLENDIQVKRLCSGLREEGYFVSTKGTIHYIELDFGSNIVKQIKTDNLFKDELFIYPNIGNDFIYVITSKNPLFEEKKDKGADKMLNLLFKQQQQLTDQYSKFIDTEFLFH